MRSSMGSTPDTAALVRQLRNGDSEAARVIFVRYAARLSRLAERHLNRKLRARIDSEDIVQSALRTFFRRSARGEFQIDSNTQLWRLLERITLMRVRAKARYHTAEMRDVRSERGPDQLMAADFAARDPDPAQAAMLVETMANLVSDLPQLHYQVLEMRLQGASAVKIAKQLKVSRSTVYRSLELLQQRLIRSEAEAQRDRHSC